MASQPEAPRFVSVSSSGSISPEMNVSDTVFRSPGFYCATPWRLFAVVLDGRFAGRVCKDTVQNPLYRRPYSIDRIDAITRGHG